jgi:stage VI sporulation protein D
MQDNQESILTFPVQHSVFISPDQSEIEQIDEIELTPHIQIKETPEEVIISGYLNLEGKYTGKPPKFPDISLDDKEMKVTGYVDSVVFNPFAMDPDDFEAENELTPFTEKIPVHICIARSKIQDVEQIYASIIWFDYDVQSARKLAVTAELALNGVKNEAPVRPNIEQVSTFPFSFEYVAGREEDDADEETEQEEPQVEEGKIEEDETKPEMEPVGFDQTEDSAESPVETLEVSTSDEEGGITVQEISMEKEAATPEIQETENEEIEPQIQRAKVQETSVSARETKAAEDQALIEQAKAEEAEVESAPVQQAKTKEAQIQQAEAKKTKELMQESQPIKAKQNTPVSETAEGSFEEKAEAPHAEEEQQEQQEQQEEQEEAKVSITLKGTKRDPVTVTTSLLSSYAQRDESVNTKEADELQTEAGAAERSAEAQNTEAERKEGALYLTSFMKTEEEKFTRMKMCIAQQDETLDEIAEKYSVSVTDIATSNGLHTNATVAKGQVLYIPVKS